MAFVGFLKANTQTIVTIGPFVNVGDGFTPETGVALGSADEAELLKHGSTSVVDISAATWAAVTSADGYYSLTLTTSHTDTEGLLSVIIQDDSVCLPVRNTFQVLAEAAYDSMFAAKDSGYMDVNLKAISEDETAADNAEADYDGTGYSKANSTIGTCTTNTDMRGTDSAALASVCTEGRLSELDGANIPADVDAILTDTGTTLDGKLDTIDGIVDAILADTDTTIPALIAALNDLSQAEANAACDTALADYDGPTNAEMEARTLAAASITKLTASLSTIISGTVIASPAPSTTTFASSGLDATDDHYNGRVAIFTSGVLLGQASDITDFDGTTGELTVTAMTEASSAGDTFIIV